MEEKANVFKFWMYMLAIERGFDLMAQNGTDYS